MSDASNPHAPVQYDIVDATFSPARTDDLKPGMERWVGRRSLWEALWVNGEEEAYPGQLAFGAAPELLRKGELVPPHPYLWVPACDLVVHSIVEESWLRRAGKEQAAPPDAPR
jgi:hypothetical protein